MKNVLTLAVLALGSVAALSAQNAPAALPRLAPTVDQILSLKRAGSPEISPDGRWVAYTVRETNWDDNAYETEIWLADATRRRAAAVDQREEVEPVTRLVAGRIEARASSRIGPTSGRSTSSTRRAARPRR